MSFHKWTSIAAGVCVAVLASGVAAAAEPPKTEANSLGMTLVLIPAGQFQRGVTDVHALTANHANVIRQGPDLQDERPAHPVQVSRPFRLGAHEVTVKQFRAFVDATGFKTDAETSGRGALAFRRTDQKAVGRFALDPKCTWRNPGFEQGDDHPVVCVSWKDAVAFCDWLGKKEGGKYRLPTEAEWEYAARAGSDTIYAGGDRPDTVREYGNVGDATLEAAAPGSVKPQQADRLRPADGDGFVHTAPVGRFKPNAWGLYDTHGNAWEWCSDRYFDRYYQQLLDDAHKKGPYPKVAITVDPQGPETTPQHKFGDWRSTRGGCWYTGPMASRHASRAFGEAADAFCHTGFRVVREEP